MIKITSNEGKRTITLEGDANTLLAEFGTMMDAFIEGIAPMLKKSPKEVFDLIFEEESMFYE